MRYSKKQEISIAYFEKKLKSVEGIKDKKRKELGMLVYEKMLYEMDYMMHMKSRRDWSKKSQRHFIAGIIMALDIITFPKEYQD